MMNKLAKLKMIEQAIVCAKTARQEQKNCPAGRSIEGD